MDDTTQARELRAVALVAEILELPDDDRLRILGYLAGMVPNYVRQALVWVTEDTQR